ncbi:uncharacterized protein PODANS_1_21720 [Podospora anserina S mat+]|uniref:Podospora anserina S mat+ genomic DNA chromosome 1, supercontig 6 n=1 Tax=Podospora anserina (strain S / ATCC MYA-4624 / DSM 980 / FGSC 10383) TaxID=515849 RepID=B2ARY5_PODAN|nr:uncharacterized protein PODANS_1_21720 [Podospora anserina S mat+]CAP67156.1 unnamed protein product [Podospora anserina S mat+]CDP24569.1 Putative protein of unknown function [Podospora anserina S mat+]
MDEKTLLRKRPSEVSIEVLDPEHYHALVKAIRNILSTELAELSIAQLIDGLPLMISVFESRGCLVGKGHPLLEHETLCDGALQQAKQLRDGFDPAVLSFSSKVCTLSRLRFETSVALFTHHPKLHSQEDIDATVSWVLPPRWIEHDGLKPRWEKDIEPHPTLFYHVNYLDYDRYTHGLADVAGYWAEDRIFGGVVLFDRGESAYECNDIYLHSGRVKAPSRIWKLLDSQFEGLVDFLMSADISTQEPPKSFPILATRENLHRHDVWDAIALHNIYRDPWERKFPQTKPEEWRDVRSIGDHPELQDAFDAITSYKPEKPVKVKLTYDERGLPVVTKRSRDSEASEDELSQASSSGKRRRIGADNSGETPPQQLSPPRLGSPPPLDSPPPLSSPPRLDSPEAVELPSSPGRSGASKPEQ